MGVPAFFRWLSRKYPSVIIDALEEKNGSVNDVSVPVDSTQPNPNGVEFDNLYLDMNGIIHPCTHPEDRPAPQNENEMMIAIFETIDRLFNIVRPRKILYMAIDGVAPRAKMNQQRSRRFRASKEACEKSITIANLRETLYLKKMYLSPESKETAFDSNCITPGTPFMDRLSVCLQYYIHERCNTDPSWKKIKIFLSDANVPGEGEHKIMNFIRKQRAHSAHDPNTQHVLCGADADLIMLGLATHEPNFTIIREKFKPNKPRPCDLCHQIGHDMSDCTGLSAPFCEDSNKVFGESVEYIFVRLSVLREYLAPELLMPDLPFPYDFERALDDWIFMCFFVGNDFLPHLPSLEIRENAIDRLVRLYKNTVYKTGGFLTSNGSVNPSRVQLIMKELGQMEDTIFKERQQKELYFKTRNNQNKMSREAGPSWIPQGQLAPMALGGKTATTLGKVDDCRNLAADLRTFGMNQSNAKAAKQLKSSLSLQFKDTQHYSEKEDDKDVDNDEVRLYEDGFKDRYYESKFGVLPNENDFRHRVAWEYTRGLCWVLLYYYQGCPSWKWFFPYHYAPFASDFIKQDSVVIEFEKMTRPFKPLEQLMSVFPAASRSHVPTPWAELMVSSESDIIDFYPEDFKIDLNGKKFAWQGVALLPWVDETRLKTALQTVEHLLTEDEKRRNQEGDDYLYVHSSHKGSSFLLSLYETSKDQELSLDPCFFDGIRGTVLSSEKFVGLDEIFSSPIAELKDVECNKVICVKYRDPLYEDNFIFPATRLEGASTPPLVLKPNNAERNWRPKMGFNDRRDQASLAPSGHRMLSHHCAQIPPPNELREREWRNNGNQYMGRGYDSQRSHSYSHNRRGTSSFPNRGGNISSYQGENSFSNNRGNYSSYQRGNSFSNNRGNYSSYQSGNSFSNNRGHYSSNRGENVEYNRGKNSNSNPRRNFRQSRGGNSHSLNHQSRGKDNIGYFTYDNHQ